MCCRSRRQGHRDRGWCRTLEKTPPEYIWKDIWSASMATDTGPVIMADLRSRCSGQRPCAGHSTPGDGGGVRRLAGAITGRVWVRGLSCDIDTLGEVESKLHAAAVAACVLGGAIDELLLREGPQAAGANLPKSLHASGGGNASSSPWYSCTPTHRKILFNPTCTPIDARSNSTA